MMTKFLLVIFSLVIVASAQQKSKIFLLIMIKINIFLFYKAEQFKTIFVTMSSMLK